MGGRGFGNQRWIPGAQQLGFHFVQRVSSVFYAETEHYIGKLDEMALRRGPRIRGWGLGLAKVVRKEHRRYECLFYIRALAFIFLSTHGAAAEARGLDKGYNANVRVLGLLRTGHIFISHQGAQLGFALSALRRLATLDHTPNWG